MTIHPLRVCCGCLAVVVAATLMNVDDRLSAESSALVKAPLTIPGAQPLFVQTAASGTVRTRGLPDHVIRRITTTVSEKAIASGAILTAEAHILNLFPDVNILALRRRVESRSSREYTWFGFFAGDGFGRVIITVANGRLGAAIDTLGKHYMVLPTGDGLHEILELDFSNLPSGDDTAPAPGYPVKGRRPAGPDPGVAAIPTPLDRAPTMWAVPAFQFDRLYDPTVLGKLGDFKVGKRDDGSVIDVLAVFTHGAARDANPSHGLILPHGDSWEVIVKIQLAIGIANDTFEASGVPTRLKLVADPYEEIDYAETGSLSSDLHAARDGLVGEVHERRDRSAADVVLFVNSGGSELAYGMTISRKRSLTEVQNAANAYIVIPQRYLLEYVIAHEFGHILGAGHEWSSLAGGDVKPYAHGYTLQFPDTNQGVTTIMVTYAECKEVLKIQCERIGRWSNPFDFTYGEDLPLGIPEGQSHAAHDARAISENAFWVANYRWSRCRMFEC
jgi:hypothetical protein